MTPRGSPFVVSMMNEGGTDAMGQQSTLHAADLCRTAHPRFFFKNLNVAVCNENFFFFVMQ